MSQPVGGKNTAQLRRLPRDERCPDRRRSWRRSHTTMRPAAACWSSPTGPPTGMPSSRPAAGARSCTPPAWDWSCRPAPTASTGSETRLPASLAPSGNSPQSGSWPTGPGSRFARDASVIPIPWPRCTTRWRTGPPANYCCAPEPGAWPSRTHFDVAHRARRAHGTGGHPRRHPADDRAASTSRPGALRPRPMRSTSHAALPEVSSAPLRGANWLWPVPPPWPAIRWQPSPKEEHHDQCSSGRAAAHPGASCSWAATPTSRCATSACCSGP
jgi:hypothetical protein